MSRRNILAAAVAAPAVVAIPFAMPAMAETASSSEWRAALQEYQEAKAACEAAEEAARAIWRKVEEATPYPTANFVYHIPAGTPALNTSIFPAGASKVGHDFKVTISELKKGFWQGLIPAEWREARLAEDDAWVKQRDRFKEKFGVAAAEERENEAFEALMDAEERLLTTPAPDPAAFATKVLILWDEEGNPSEERMAPVLAEARRFARVRDA